MNSFSSALWAETLKLRRSKVPLFTAIGFSIPALVGGLFMIILKDPARAQSMGLISAKAQLTVEQLNGQRYSTCLPRQPLLAA